LDTQLSKRIQRIQPSPTLSISAKVNTLKAAGQEIINLSTGEPDFDTPDHIKQAAIEAIKKGYTKYTQVEGLLPLREAIVAKFKRDNQLIYTPKQITVSCGAKHSIYNITQVLLNPDDEVIIPAPFWTSYPDIVTLSGAKSIIINTSMQQKFKVTPAVLEKHITPRTRLILLNSPSNPTGIAYSKEELAALGKVLIKYPNIYILSDDIYEHVLWSKQPFANIIMACPELYDRTILVNGVSKTYAMTGWRIGYTAAPTHIADAMAKLQSQTTSNPCSIAQYATIVALNQDQEHLHIRQNMLQAFKERHDYIVAELNSIKGIECIPGDGTFYSFFKVKELIEQIKGINNDIELAEYLIEEAKVAFVPGSAFGSSEYLRLSFATSLDLLKKAIYNLKRVL
jgi:aspartate aminotransferase